METPAIQRAKCREYYAAHRESILAKKKKYYRSGYAKERKHFLNKEYRKKHKARLKINTQNYIKTDTGKHTNRKGKIKCKYGITMEQFDEMVKNQNGVCAICGNPETNMQYGIQQRLSIDHDHKTGKVRGLLCLKCNVRLGVIENEEFIKKAKSYLEKYIGN